jgi:hypothetical protein
LRQLFDHQQRRSDLRIRAACFENLAIALGLGFEHLLRALCFGGVLGQDGIRFALGLNAAFLGLGRGGDLNALLGDFLRSDFIFGQSCQFLIALGKQGGLFRLGIGDFGPASPGTVRRCLPASRCSGATCRPGPGSGWLPRPGCWSMPVSTT